MRLPDCELSLAVVQEWVEAHRSHGADLHDRAYFIAKMSMMRHPGHPDREIAEWFWAGVQGARD